MRILFYLLRKEFMQIRRNKAILPMIFAVPVIQMMVLVYAANFEMKGIQLAVTDRDMSDTSAKITATFNGNAFFAVQQLSVSQTDPDECLKKGDADALLVIPADFERQLFREQEAQIQLLVDAVDGNKAQLVAAYCRSVLGKVNRDLASRMAGMTSQAAPVQIRVADNFWYNPRLDYKWFMAPGILAILVTVIGMFMSGLNLVREKEMGTVEQMNVTPVLKTQFILAKLIPFWIIGMFDLAFGLIIARILFSLPLEGSWFVLFGMTAIYLVGVLGMGLLLSTFAETQQQMLFLTFFFALVFILMGGIFTPSESMPEWAQTLNRGNPMYYFMRTLRMIILKGSGWYDLREEIISLVVLGTFFVTLAIRRYRKTA